MIIVQNSNPVVAANDETSAKSHKRPVPNRAGIDASGFQKAVLDHLVFTCAKDATDASTFDMYQALAHSVRDRLVHRWLLTQRTYEAQDVKRAYYLSSEFLTGRS